jgi:uncharacterized protein YkwD
MCWSCAKYINDVRYAHHYNGKQQQLLRRVDLPGAVDTSTELIAATRIMAEQAIQAPM